LKVPAVEDPARPVREYPAPLIEIDCVPGVQGLPSVQVCPLTVVEAFASALFGIGEAATASEGEVVELVTVGTSQVGQLPDGVAKDVTVPPLVEQPRLAQAVAAVVVSKFHEAVIVPSGPICTE